MLYSEPIWLPRKKGSVKGMQKSCSWWEQVRWFPAERDPPGLKLQHSQRQTHRGSAADKFYRSPSGMCLISNSHSATVALKVSQKPCSEQTILACFPQLPAARCAETHTGPTRFVPNSYCTVFCLLCVHGSQAGGKTASCMSRTHVTSKTNPVLQFYCLYTKLSTAPVQTSHC